MTYNKSQKLLFLFSICLVIVSSVLNTAAQSESATLLGTVRDANSAVLLGANVTLKNAATGISSTTTTDS